MLLDMEDRQPITRVAYAAARVFLVCIECIATGWAVGTAAHFFGGSFAFGLDLSSFQFAVFEGGINGAIVGLPVGLLVYYGIFRSRATRKDWAILIGVAFVTAAITFLPLGLLTLIVTPIVTMVAAVVLRSCLRSATRLV